MGLRSILCACGLALCAHAAAAQGLTLPQALQAARENLDVAIARSGLAAARADILAANHAPLPQLTAKASSIDLDHGIGGGSLLGRKRIDKSIGIDWTWERGNKRALRTQSAEQLADAALADLDDVVVQQLLATQAAFLELMAAQERIALVDALADDARQLAGTAARRAKAGDLPLQDQHRIEIEAERAAADALGAALERQRAALALAQLMGRTDMADRLAVQGAWTLPEVPAASDLSALVLMRADVRAAQARLQAAQLAVDAARALCKTDVTWGVSYDHYPGSSRALVELRAQVPLQWGYAYEGEIGRALAQLRQAQDQQDKLLRSATLELQRLQLEASGARARARRYEAEIIPRAQRVAQTAETADQRGAMGLTDLLDARRTLRTTLVEAVAMRLEAAKAVGAWRLRTQPAAAETIDFTPSSTQGLP